jgi:hypothetical protein
LDLSKVKRGGKSQPLFLNEFKANTLKGKKLREQLYMATCIRLISDFEAIRLMQLSHNI